MTRQARRLSATGIYHVMLRGNEKKAILREDAEKSYFLDCLSKKRNKTDFNVYAYCLMDNHVHLLIDARQDDLAAIMKGIATGYAYFYNTKHERVGHVFQDRFKSEPIEDDRYLMAVVRYIHGNPVVAGIVKRAADYPWSSYGSFVDPVQAGPDWLDSAFILAMIAADRTKAIREFERFSAVVGVESFIDVEDQPVIRTLDKGQAFLQQYLRQNGVTASVGAIGEDRHLCQRAISYLRANTGLSQRKIADLLGVDKGVVERAMRRSR